MANFTTIRVPGQSSVVADSDNDTLDLIPGTGITITTDSTLDAITFSAAITAGYAGSVGVTGFTGSRGAIGYQGSQGITGFTGSIGNTGFAGSVGTPGQIGFTGSVAHSYRTFRVAGQTNLVADQLEDVIDLIAGPGIAITTNASIDAITITATGGGGGGGSDGFTGSQGDTGFTGSQGFTGNPGASGATGFTGSIGELGFTGSRGLTGFTGNTGFTGSIGSQGFDGFTGSAGDVGFTGSVGTVGFTGSVGNDGTTGFTGSQGPTGDLGYTGSVGIAGDVGYTGSGSTVPGYTGSLGYTGSSGTANTALIVACSDELTPLTSGTAKTTFRMPYNFNLTGVRASLTTAQTSGSTLTVDINQAASSILSTKITVANGDKSSLASPVQPVTISTPFTLTDDAEITVDIDQLGDGTATGLKITLIGYM